MMLQLSGRHGLEWRMLPAIKLAFSIAGRGWHQFYAWMLDRQERDNNIDKILGRNTHVPGKDKGLYDISRGPIHAPFLKANGLNPNHRFLDFGAIIVTSDRKYANPRIIDQIRAAGEFCMVHTSRFMDRHAQLANSLMLINPTKRPCTPALLRLRDDSARPVSRPGVLWSFPSNQSSMTSSGQPTWLPPPTKF